MRQQQISPGSLAIYAENWPTDEQYASTGLNRALVPVVAAVAPLKPDILLAPRRLRSSLYPLHATVAAFSRAAPLPLRVADSVRQWITGGRSGAPFASAYLDRCLRRGRHKTLLSVLGGDPQAYIRADALATAAGAAHFIYSVDDPFEWEHAPGKVAAAHDSIYLGLRRAFCAAAGLLAITTELADRYSERLGRSCLAAPLPYCEDPVTPRCLKRQFIYVGNMNYLYAGGFKEIVDALGDLRADGQDITLRATLPRTHVERVLVTVPEWIVCGRIDNRHEFLAEIADSLLAVCPISPDLPNLALTSFPSKLIDYLAHSRCILVHGPANCVAVRYFNDNGLAFVSTDRDSLRSVLGDILGGPQNHTAAYRKALYVNHSIESFRRKIEDLIKRRESA